MNTFSIEFQRALFSIGIQRIAVFIAAVLLSACTNMSGIQTSAHMYVVPTEYVTAMSLPNQGPMA
ncbi:MAG: hypothetical protein H7240_12680 [Glaciimonas sp.]|nr:hypothetical protein [Glaciimonas sp.]